jgi:hypothetical protein
VLGWSGWYKKLDFGARGHSAQAQAPQNLVNGMIKSVHSSSHPTQL